MFEQDLSDQAFAGFARPATLVQITSAGPSNESTVDVIVDSDIEVVDEGGNIRDYSFMITFNASDRSKVVRGAQVTFEGMTYQLEDVLTDDGYLIEVAAQSVS